MQCSAVYERALCIAGQVVHERVVSFAKLRAAKESADQVGLPIPLSAVASCRHGRCDSYIRFAEEPHDPSVAMGQITDI